MNRFMEMLRGTAEVSDSQMKEVVNDIGMALQGERETNNMLKESLAELELRMDDEGWRRLGWEGEREFSRDGLRKITDMSRIMTLKNPIIQRAVEIRSFYVWGQSVEIKGRSETVNDEVIQPFIEDIGNRRELFSHASRILKDKALATDGNIFFVLDTSYITGKVNLRSIPFDEIEDIILNPDDGVDVWYYVRSYEQKKFDHRTGKVTSKHKKAYYPDYWYALKRQKDKSRPSRIGDAPVIWSQPVYHMKSGGLDGMRFGVPETYSSLDWARAYKSFLEDWASLVRAISMFAWKYTTKKNKLKASRQKLEELTGEHGDRTPAGSTFIGDKDGDLIPINKSGATTSAADGKMLRLMVASGMHLPDTMLSNDPQQGALATAKTLDRPTELAMSERQNTWSDTIRAILFYVLVQAVEAAVPVVDGSYDADTNTLTININEDNVKNPATIDVIFPSIVVPDQKDQIEAIVGAMTLNGKTPANIAPDDVFRGLLLNALGVEDVDEIIENMEEDDIATAAAVSVAEESLKDFVEKLRDVVEKRKAA